MVLAPRCVHEHTCAAERVAELPGLEEAAPLDARRLVDLLLLEELQGAIALDARDAQPALPLQPAQLPRLDEHVEAALLRISGVGERVDVALPNAGDRRRARGLGPSLDRDGHGDGR